MRQLKNHKRKTRGGVGETLEHGLVQSNWQFNNSKYIEIKKKEQNEIFEESLDEKYQIQYRDKPMEIHYVGEV